MWAKLLLVASLLQPGVFQQTPPPTADIPTMMETTFYFLASPTPIPSFTPLPTQQSPISESGVYNFLVTAAANLNALPDDPASPGGVSLSSAAVSTGGIFNYGKWLFSNSSALELLGVKLSVLAFHVNAAFAAIIITSGFDLLLRMVVILVKGVVWLIQQILKFVPFIG